MTRRILILGGGTGGTIMANRLRKRLAANDVAITVVDRDDQHVYQPGLLFVPFGLYDAEEIVRPRQKQLHAGITYVQAPVDSVHVERNEVVLQGGETLGYDVLIVATGTRLLPEETPGLSGPGWREKVFDFYTVEGATALRGALEAFQGGKLVVDVVDMPIKCPVAPLEFAFLADWYFHTRGIRDRVEITYVTPLDGAFTTPVASKALKGMLAEKGVALVTEFNAGEVDGPGGRLVSYDEREVPFDLLVAVPVHGGAEYIGRSPGLGDALGFVATDPQTLQSKVAPNVFALGDATSVPTSKAGSVTHFEAEILADNVCQFLASEPLTGHFDGHSNCFIETGFDKALLIDFNYETEPLPGKFPFAAIGPLHLLKETKMNHLGKLMFQWFYWHALLPGRGMPGVPSKMSMSGKEVPAKVEEAKT